jgi:hypothetical protein
MILATYTALSTLLLFAPETDLKRQFDFLGSDGALTMFLQGALTLVLFVVPFFAQPGRVKETRRVYAAFLFAALAVLPGVLPASAYSLLCAWDALAAAAGIAAVALAAAGLLLLLDTAGYFLCALAVSGGLPLVSFTIYRFGGRDAGWLCALSPFSIAPGGGSFEELIGWIIIAGVLGAVVWYTKNKKKLGVRSEE